MIARNFVRRWGNRLAVALVPAIVLVSSGCYYGQLALGQSDIVFSSEPIGRVIFAKRAELAHLERVSGGNESANTELAARMKSLADEIAKLELIVDARRYAAERLALVQNANYTIYFETGGRRRYPSYVVTAVHPTELKPHTFEFLVVGELPYKGFFVKEMAEREAAELQAAGLDVSWGPVTAYSTLGNFADPVFTSMLNRDAVELAGLIFHELLHATVWHPRDADFNESLATWVERKGTIIYLTERLHDADKVAKAEKRFADSDIFSQFIGAKKKELEAFYAAERAAGTDWLTVMGRRHALFLTFQREFVRDRRAGRYATTRFDWFALAPLNNADFLQTARYNAGLGLYEAVWNYLDKDFTLAIQVFQDAAATESPRAFLENWLRARGEPVPSASVATAPSEQEN